MVQSAWQEKGYELLEFLPCTKSTCSVFVSTKVKVWFCILNASLLTMRRTLYGSHSWRTVGKYSALGMQSWLALVQRQPYHIKSSFLGLEARHPKDEYERIKMSINFLGGKWAWRGLRPLPSKNRASQASKSKKKKAEVRASPTFPTIISPIFLHQLKVELSKPMPLACPNPLSVTAEKPYVPNGVLSPTLHSDVGSGIEFNCWTCTHESELFLGCCLHEATGFWKCADMAVGRACGSFFFFFKGLQRSCTFGHPKITTSMF